MSQSKGKWKKAQAVAAMAGVAADLKKESMGTKALEQQRLSRNRSAAEHLDPDTRSRVEKAAAAALDRKQVREDETLVAVGSKQGGTTAGAVVILERPPGHILAAANPSTGQQKYLKKEAQRNANSATSPKQEFQNKQDLIKEYIFSKFYNILLYDRAPEINLVVDKESLVTNSSGVVSLAASSASDNVSLTSKFFPNFETLSQLSGDTTGRNGAIVKDSPELQRLEGFEKVIASCLLLGEPDYHAGNIGVIKELDENGKYKVVKIDHGRSGTDFSKDLPDLIAKLHKAMSEAFDYDQIPFDTGKFREAIEQMSAIGRNTDARGNAISNEIDSTVENAISALSQVGMIDRADIKPQIQEYTDGIKKQLDIMKELAARLEIIEKIDLLGENWMKLIGAENPIIWAMENGYAIGTKDPISWAIDNQKTIDGKDPVVYLFDNGIKVEGKEARRWAVEEAKPIEGKDPARWIVERALDMEGGDPMVWCITATKANGEGVTIEGKDPLLWAAEHRSPIGGLDPITWASNEKFKIDNIEPVTWAVINSIEGKPILIDGKDLIIYAQDRGEKIEDKEPLLWAVEHHRPIAGLNPINWAISNGKQIGGEQKWNPELHIEEQIGGISPAQYCFDNNLNIEKIIATDISNYSSNPQLIEEAYRAYQACKKEVYVGLPENIAKALAERAPEVVEVRSHTIVESMEPGTHVRRVLSERNVPESNELTQESKKSSSTNTQNTQSFGEKYKRAPAVSSESSKGGSWD